MSLYRYESGARVPDAIQVIELAKALGVSPSAILEDESSQEPKRLSAAEADTVQLIPVLGEVPAGIPMQRALSDYADAHIRVDLDNLAHRGDTLFALRVVGDSMVGAGIYHGDYAVCSMMSVFDVGDVVAVYQIENGESTVKQLGGWDRKKGRMLLTPYNLAYHAFEVDLQPDDQVRRVIAVVRRLPVRA